MQKVCVLGLGYIGLPTASVLAANGYEVLGVDVSPHVVTTVNEGGIHIEEPGLQTLVRAATGSGNLRAAHAPEPADVFVLALPTPLTEEKAADMTYVVEAAESIVPHLAKGALVILESTSPPGTCRNLIRPIIERSGLKVGEELLLAHCPERVLPGKILKELIDNDRVIGGYDAASAERAREIYATFVEGQIFLTDVDTAEMVKLIENTYRDVNIALANETAVLCEDLGINFWEVRRFANRHPRVDLHSAGPGVGGHCISVDPWFLVELQGEQSRIIRTARERNTDMPRHVVAASLRMLEGVTNPKVAVLGLAYKGNVDDTRESPALDVLDLLRGEGVDVAIHDPHVTRCSLPLASREECLRDADLVLLLTDHLEYLELDPVAAGDAVRRKLLFDTRNLLDHAAWKAAGFRVKVLGAGNGVG